MVKAENYKILKNAFHAMNYIGISRLNDKINTQLVGTNLKSLIPNSPNISQKRNNNKTMSRLLSKTTTVRQFFNHHCSLVMFCHYVPPLFLQHG